MFYKCVSGDTARKQAASALLYTYQTTFENSRHVCEGVTI
jgi:hypothetical protein